MIPVVMLHGWAMNAACWSGMPSADSHYCPDLPGHGDQSRLPMPEDIDELARLMLERHPFPAIWCGWSLGGMLAMRAACLAPQQVKGLVLVCTTPSFINRADWNLGVDLSLLDDFSGQMKADPERGLRRFLLLMFNGDPAARSASRQLADAVLDRGLASSQAMAAGLRILGGTDLRQSLARIDQPVRLVGGRYDQVCPPSASQWMAEAREWPCTLVDSGHAPMIARGDEIAAEIARLQEQLAHAG